MSITPGLLKSMGTAHAIYTLRVSLGAEFAWLPDWIENEISQEDRAITAAAEKYGMDAADVEALGGAYFESITHTCAVLEVLNGEPGFGGTPEELQQGILMLRRLEKAGITTLDELELLLDGPP